MNDLSGVVMANGHALKYAVVWLEAAGTVKPEGATVNQRGKSFSPRLTVVPVGSTVSFPNNDDIFHNVFAEYNAKKFDLGMYPKGETKQVVFDKPGPVSLLCNLHSNMSAYIFVVNSRFYTTTDKNGKFSLRDVPMGSYDLRGWHESGLSGSVAITNRMDMNAIRITLSRK